MFMGDGNGTNVVQDVGYPIMDDILTSSTFPISLWSLRLRSTKSSHASMLWTEKLKRATDEDERRRLLKEFRALLGKADAKTSEC
jgi:hypothetical protein